VKLGFTTRTVRGGKLAVRTSGNAVFASLRGANSQKRAVDSHPRDIRSHLGIETIPANTAPGRLREETASQIGFSFTSTET
jgi:hypothetical protein